MIGQGLSIPNLLHPARKAYKEIELLELSEIIEYINALK
jgi:hypothetical protein